MKNDKLYVALISCVIFIITIVIIHHYSKSSLLKNHAGPLYPDTTVSGNEVTLPSEQNGTFQPLPEPWPGDWLSTNIEPGQTVKQFVDFGFIKPDSVRNCIYLQPLWDIEKKLNLSLLYEFIECYFALDVRILHPVTSSKNLFSPRQNPSSLLRFQINADDIHTHLMNNLPEDAFCVIGITAIDLYSDISDDFVLGTASLGGRVGVISIARYDPHFLGRKRKESYSKTLIKRTVKTLAHEIGHTFGFDHCIFYSCNMNGANTLNESDSQPIHLCPVCLKKIKYSSGFNTRKRYMNLREFYYKAELENQALWVKNRILKLSENELSDN